MASTLVLQLQLLLVSLASASHHFGGTVTFTYKGRNPDGTFRVDFRNRATFDGCQYSHFWYCYNSNCGTNTRNQRGVLDRSTNAPQYNNQWCETETVSTRNLQSDKPFQMRSGSCCWIPTRNFVSYWRLLTSVDLGSRSDTGKPNRSPDIAILPFLRVPQNCQRTYKLMSFDPDGDKVRCRYGNLINLECHSCTHPSGFVLDQGSCTLYYRNSLANPRVYAFELVVEDFPQRHITLSYTDGSKSPRAPLNVRRKRQAPTSWGGWQSTTTATTSAPYTTGSWYTGHTTTAATTTAAPYTTGSWHTGHTTTAATTSAAPFTTGSWHTGHTTTAATTTAAPYTTGSWHTGHTTTAATTSAAPFTTGSWHTGHTTTAATTSAAPFTTGSWHTGHTTTAATTSAAPFTTGSWHTGHTTTAAATTAAPYTTGSWHTGHTTTAATTTAAPFATGSWHTGHTTTAATTTAASTTRITTVPYWYSSTTTAATTTGATTTAASTTRITTVPYWYSSTTTAATTTAATTTAASTTRITTVPYWYSSTTKAATTTAAATPLSKLPLQFSFLVDPPAPSCQEGQYLPKFVHPTPENGERLQAEVNKEVEIRVKAQATFATIHDIIISGPLNISKHKTTHGEFVIRWTPIPDDLGDVYPICFAVESVTGSYVTTVHTTTHNHGHHHPTPSSQSGIYQSEMRCVLVDIRKNQVKSHVKCNESSMTVAVEKSSFPRGLHEDHLRLSDPTNTVCSLQKHSNSTHVIAVVPLNACGTQIEEDDDNLIFRNEITTVDNVKDLITRKHLLEMQFYCQYLKRGNVTRGFTAHRKTVSVWDKGFGRFTYQFEFYPDRNFETMIDPNLYPLEYYVGDRIYMQIEATSSVNNTELFVESCRAAPYDNPNYRPTYPIIDNGCKVDSTVVMYSNTHKNQFRFSMEAFAFIGLYDQVYISCSVLMCEAGSHGTRCSKGCMNPTSWPSSQQHHHRRKRAAVSQSSRHFISQGPLRLRRSAESTGSPVSNLNVNLVFIAGCLLAAVGMISAVATYKAKRSKVKYQPLPTCEG